MNRPEYLLACLVEECAEIQKEATKALRFGLDDNWKNGGTQADRINSEFADLMGVYEMCVNECMLDDVDMRTMINLKKEKVERYMEYAEERGTLVQSV